MISDIKMGLKLFKYSLSFKSTVTMYIIFFGLGVLFTILTPESGADSIIAMGGAYMALSGAYVGQMLFNVNIGKIIQSSPYKCKLQTKIPNLFSFISILFSFTMFILIKVVQIKCFGCFGTEELLMKQTFAVIMTAVMSFCMLLYIGVAFKKYVLSTVFLFITIIPMMLLMMSSDRLIGFVTGISFGLAIFIGYAIIIVGFLLSLLVSRMVYKLDIEENSYKKLLERVK